MDGFFLFLGTLDKKQIGKEKKLNRRISYHHGISAISIGDRPDGGLDHSTNKSAPLAPSSAIKSAQVFPSWSV